MSNKKNGDSAFPQNFDCNISENLQGMSLRDYFAAKAMNGWLSVYADLNWPTDEGIDKIATMSYKLADAMLKAREK